MKPLATETRIFLGLGAFTVVVTAVYWFTSYEDAGTTMLLLAAGLSLLTGGYLWLQGRRQGVAAGDEGEPAEAEGGGSLEADNWFPHASVWPFGIGVASFFLANGLILGSWFLVPGGIILLVTVVGLALQSRARSHRP